MAAEYDTKAVLLDWMKEGENKHCSECHLPSPQWCSLSYGTTLCLSCSGVHRSLGVHLSFVRSLTMDKWTQPQMQRMLAGGNQKAREFFEGSGQSWKSDNLPEKYNTHVAAMYRDKLLADAEGRPWIPTDTPAPNSSSASLASTASSGLRKPRTQSSIPSRSATSSPVSYNAPSSGGASGSNANANGGGPGPTSQKAQNENYFARLGSANANRSADLPPSQGGRYSGFGSTPSGPSGGAGNGGPGNALSSRNLPGFDDLRDDPVGALSKGWGFFGAALGAVGKTVNESVIQPGLERAHDPALQSQFSTFLSTAQSSLSTVARTSGQVLSSGLETSSQFLKRDLGVDVGDLGAHYLDRHTGRGAGEGYGPIGEEHAPGTGGDFFAEHMGGGGSSSASGSSRTTSGAGTPNFAAGGMTGIGAAGRGKAREPGFEDAVGGLRDMPTVERSSSSASTVPTIPPPELDGDWSTMAPKAAAARAAQAAKASVPEQKKKDDDGWGDFEDF
ncbi:hypothetical protein JCM10212_006944 [Sporobolomyces blumeae]